MATKTTKTTTKKAEPKKAEPKKVETKKVETATVEPVKETAVKSEIKESTTLESYVQKIFYCLVVMTALLAFIAVGVFMQIDTKSSLPEEAEQELEYDISKFQKINADDFVKAYKGSETKVIYIGRATCGYCRAFIPALQQAQNDYGYKTLYLDIEDVEAADISKITSLNTWFNDYYGTTPLVVVVKDGAIVGEGWIGYADYATFAEYLDSMGFKKVK